MRAGVFVLLSRYEAVTMGHSRLYQDTLQYNTYSTENVKTAEILVAVYDTCSFNTSHYMLTNPAKLITFKWYWQACTAAHCYQTH